MKRRKSGRNSMVKTLAAGTAALLMAGAALAVEPQAGKGGNVTVPEVMDLNAQEQCPDIKGLPKDKKGVAGFTHAAHIARIEESGKKGEAVCLTCHADDPSAQGWDPCRSLAKSLEEKGGPKKLAAYFHDTCKACHLKLKKEGAATGPVKCSGCHGRKRKK